MRLARTLLEEIAAGVGFGDLPDKFKEAEFSSFYLKKYTERDNKCVTFLFNCLDNPSIYRASIYRVTRFTVHETFLD